MLIRVLHADDHPILRKGVTDLLNQTEGMEWVGSAENGQEALEKIRALKPDVAILDVEMPILTGLAVAQTLLTESSSTRLILLTIFNDPTFMNRALQLGVKGYLLKDSSEKEILEGIRYVYEGRPYVSASMTQYLINQPSNPNKDILSQLSNHEINIVKLIARQKTSLEIADMLFISPKTVANHRANISKKLALDGQQNGLLKWALEHRDLLSRAC
jgi:DNA-binding NarL/FixJ family response regulator